MKFSEYSFASDIKRNLESMGFSKPTDIQFKSIAPILKGEDLLAIAQTGTGKTAAFAIPIIDRIEKDKTSKRTAGIKAIIMAPTRELAVQITKVFEQIAKKTKVRTLCVHGGVDQDPQIQVLVKGVDILIATPGRMFDLASQGFIVLNKVQTLVLDEADHMLDLGFIHDIKQLVKFLPGNRQTLFFSATINKEIKEIAYTLIRSTAIRIQISPKDPVAKNIKHSVCFIEMDDKRFFLERLIKENADSKILVFVRTKVRAERVAKAMNKLDVNAHTIHGGKEQAERSQVMKGFRSGAIKVLIATDVSARGIDIDNVEHVVNYDLPDVPENYVHRVGRTGRGRHKGNAVSFCSKIEKPLLDEIEKFTGAIKVLDINKSEYQETIDFSEDKSLSVKELMDQIQEIDNKTKKRKGKKK
jgi:ATP-dependent RNA helicase RhlE